MTRPTPGGDLLSQRPHTTLPADEDTADEDDDESATAAIASEQQQEQEHENPLEQVNEQLNELLEDAEEDELKLTDFQRYWRRLQSMVLHQANLDWRLHGPTSAAAASIGSTVRGGQEVGSHLTQLYASRHLGVKFTPFDPGPGITERPGADKLMVYSRPIRERSLAAQLRRLGTLANTDLQLAKTRTLFSAFDEDMVVNRAPVRTFRRVTTSEKPCALCEIAAQQLYFTTDLMPIHDNCMCDVEMADEEDVSEHEARYHHLGFVDTLLDIGEQTKDIQQLADADADLEDYVNLTKIEQHGELGPVIRWAGQKFTGPGDLPDPRGVRPVPSISGPGRGHEARLGRNAARVAQYRRQKDNVLRYSPGHGGITTYLPPTPKVTRPIPIRPEPRIAPVIQMRPKAIDFRHDPVDDVVQAMTDKYAGRVGAFGPEWKDPQYNEGTKRAVLQALDEMMTKYPQVHFADRVVIEDAHGDWAGLTGYTRSGEPEYIKFDANVMRMPPDKMKESWSRFRDRFHFPSAADDPARYLVYHEFGHALDATGGFEARDTVNQTVANMFTRSGRAQEVRPDDPPGKINRVILENQDAMRKWMGEQLSGYSMIDGYLPDQINPDTGRLGRMGLSRPEALAQAFSDVELRGDRATDVSRAIHGQMVDAVERPHPIRPAATAATPRAAVDRLAELTEPKPNWTAEQMSEEDNHAKNAAGEEILSDEHRALARQLATEIWTKGAKVEPAITAAAVSSSESLGGFMSGLNYRQKTGPSLYRKIQAEAIDLAHGAPVDEDDLRAAAKGIKDAVRYTAVMPEEGYWAKGDDLRKALESLGAKTIKDPVGIPLHGYRGRNMSFTLNDMPFEMQVHTELGVAVKDEAHKIYDVSRKLESDLKARGRVPDDDPTFKKLLADMQAKWDTMPITKGTPVVQTEKDAKSGDVNKVMYVAPSTRYRGPSIPGGGVPLDSPEMVGRARVPSTRYGMEWLPGWSETEGRIVAPARAVSEDLWSALPIEMLPHATSLRANEGTLKKKSIDKVVSGREPFREGYTIKLYRSDDGQLHIVDGHTRVAMYHALGQDMPVRIMDDRMLQMFTEVK